MAGAEVTANDNINGTNPFLFDWPICCCLLCRNRYVGIMIKVIRRMIPPTIPPMRAPTGTVVCDPMGDRVEVDIGEEFELVELS